MKLCSLLSLMLLLLQTAPAQKSFTRADTLRGLLTPLRTCYDVRFYDLSVRIDPATKSLRGSNTIRFTTTEDFNRMQIDLFANMSVDSILAEDGSHLSTEREFNAVFVSFPQRLKKGTTGSIVVHYSGMPQEANRPPWEGGFTWTNDSTGKPWIAVTCQGTGASLWWPNKDHQSDEPDSMMLRVTIPPGLSDVSNGRLRSVKRFPDGWSEYDWFIASPINNYDVTVNIGNYSHFGDLYLRHGDTLTLDYYVMPYNLKRAHEQFTQVRAMLACFEKYFGPYPFPADGYKLIECPHLGMEHQSAIAYGNHFLNGYRGQAMSAVGPSSETGLKFDFIIVHESAHEWWGNSITASDIADMWIHESFGAYAEALFVECRWGHDEALAYINAKKSSILNDRPMIGPYGVNQPGSKDMYNKGQVVLNTLRSVINDDPLWFSIIHDMATTFRHSIVTADSIFNFINRRTGTDYGYFFDQYFRHTGVPQLEAFVTKKAHRITLKYKWNADVADFRMPVRATTAPDTFTVIHPTTSWQTMELNSVDPMKFRVADDLYFVTLKLGWAYVDPRKVE